MPSTPYSSLTPSHGDNRDEISLGCVPHLFPALSGSFRCHCRVRTLTKSTDGGVTRQRADAPQNGISENRVVTHYAKAWSLFVVTLEKPQASVSDPSSLEALETYGPIGPYVRRRRSSLSLRRHPVRHVVGASPRCRLTQSPKTHALTSESCIGSAQGLRD